MKKAILLLLVCISFSCADNDIGTQGSINLKVNGCFDKFESGAKICLDSIFNDSRCPTGVVCVWEGDAVAAFTLTKNNTVRSFNLHTNSKFQNDTIIEGIAIKLIKITPYPLSDQPIDPDDYKAEISVNKN
ncbi:hypothetical protein [Gelidibacter gilvus]|uniref:Lipoprotein n=1 Tax=Gelidibacter gilvus TaxID=59602 RepID=A0A4Q0XK01_9FLAO|nr:hypothetical protein [Gelidibacter gilvus]RXJ52304.1 hypothetical protein ESZ48_00980 [Gelidibacter gilvus]